MFDSLQTVVVSFFNARKAAHLCTFGVVAAFLGVTTAPAAATPPVPSKPTASCDATSGTKCFVDGSFTLSSYSAGAHHYRFCRSSDTTGWGGCAYVMTRNSGSSFTVSGSNLPSDGYRRAYYVSACNSANECTAWGSNTETYVTMDQTGPTTPGDTFVACNYTDGGNCWVDGSFTISASPSSDSGSGVSGYRICRSEDTTGWGGCNVNLVPVGSGGTSLTVGGSHLPSDGYRRAYLFQARDAVGNWSAWNTRRYVRVDRHAPTVSASNTSSEWFTSRTATLSAADATGGEAANSGLAEVRYQWNGIINFFCGGWGTATSSGATLTVPEGDNTLNLCARDNTGTVTLWSGTYRVDSGPPTTPGPTTVDCAYSTNGECWVTGAFTATAAPSTDAGTGVDGYQFCRSHDTTGWGGCAVNIVPAGSAGTSEAVSGSHLPSDGYRRAYRFRARDGLGQWSAWNTPRYVRVDRYAPTVSASNASSQWFTSRTATVSAADGTGGGAANSGLAAARFRWNGVLNGACTNGTATSAGATLSVPEGDNTLYLCARDQTGRVTKWNGTYRVDSTGPSLDSLTVSSGFWSIGDGSTYQITARASDTGSGVRELRALINLKGDNSDQRRGNFSWRDDSLGYLWTADRVPCTGGGFASKRPDAFNPDTVTLVGCTTSLAGAQRTVTFTVRPEASFGEIAPNDIAFWARDFELNPRGWKNFDLNFAAGLRPPPSLEAREQATGVLPDGGTVAWGDVDEGTGNGIVARTFTVENVAPAGSGNLLLEHSPSNVEVTGSSAFTVGGILASPLAVGEQDSFNVRLDTDQVGQHSAQLQIWHNDPLRPSPLVIELTARVLGKPVVDENSPNPFVIQHGSTTTLTVDGQHLQGASIYVATEPPEGTTSDRVFPTAQLVSVNSTGTRLRASVNAQAAGVDGFYNLIIETPTGKAAAQFRVVGPEPVIDAWTPSEPVAGRVHVLQVMGANLAGAGIVPMSSGVLILDVDSSDDHSLSGLLFVSSDVPSGALDLRIDGVGGSTVLPMEVRPDMLSAGPETQEVTADGTSGDGLTPSILLQNPISAYSAEELASSLGIRSGDLPESSAQRTDLQERNFCFSGGGRRVLRFNAVLFSLLDQLDDPLTREAINALVPGDVLRFTSLTAVLSGFLEFEFHFKFCNDGLSSDADFCVSGGISVMVPAVGGLSTSFDFCASQFFQTDLGPSGGITSHSYSSSSDCLAVNDLNPGSVLGERSGEFVMNCCENATIGVTQVGSALERPFVIEQDLIETDLKACIPPDSCTCTATLEDLVLQPPLGFDDPTIFGESSLEGTIRNDSTAACQYTVSLRKVGGSPDASFSPETTTVDLPAGESITLSELSAEVRLAQDTRAADAATIELEASAGAITCTARSLVCPASNYEVSVFREWRNLEDLAEFEGVVLPRDADFATREVKEDLTGFHDGCYFLGSDIPRLDSNSIDAGGRWTIKESQGPDLHNLYGPDIIGVEGPHRFGPVYGPTLQEGESCTMGFNQQMSMACPSPLGWQDYRINPVVISVTKLGGSAYVQICREPEGCSTARE